MKTNFIKRNQRYEKRSLVVALHFKKVQEHQQSSNSFHSFTFGSSLGITKNENQGFADRAKYNMSS
jgi:hypothetical protein